MRQTEQLKAKRDEWLGNLKPGDTVAVRAGASIRVGEVVKRTPSGMIDVRWPSGNVERFSADGWERGRGHGFYARGMLEPLTEELKDELLRQRAIRTLSVLRPHDLEKLPTANLLQAEAHLREGATVFDPAGTERARALGIIAEARDEVLHSTGVYEPNDVLAILDGISAAIEPEAP